ncbi:MAG: helix-hairpin-helix domain-containing protein [Steroidobacteraceae bacterium]
MRRLILSSLLCIGAALASAEPVDINSADAPTIARALRGIGTTRAQAIVEYRKKNGPFRTADDLALVRGIGQKVIDQNRKDILLGRSSKPASSARPAPKREN